MKSTIPFFLASAFLLFPVPSHGTQQGAYEQLLARAQDGEARQVLEEIDARLREGENRQLLFLKARLLAQTGQDGRAIAAYRDLIERYPELPEPYNNLAALLASQGDLEEAQQLLEEAMHTDPSYAAIYENLSVVFVALARDSYGKALRINHTANSVAMQELAALNSAAPPARETSQEIARLETSKESKSPVTSANVPSPGRAPIQDEPADAAPQVEASNSPASPPEQARQLAKATLPTYPAPGREVVEKDVITALEDWARAWSSQEIERYLAHYAPDYRPSDMSHAAWQRQRHQRLSKPEWIEVELSEIDVARVEGETATVRLVQRYRSDTYQDRTRKRLVLRRGSGDWRITEETTLELLSR